MKPSFRPRLVNDPFSDPGLFIPFRFERRALLFDLGDLSRLSPRELLCVSHVFVTHTHMDHFIGFDTLLRILLGRDKSLTLFGPPGFFKHVEGKLAGYTWNLVHEYTSEFRLEVHEVHPHEILTRNYACRDRFRPVKRASRRPFSGTLMEEPTFTIKGVLLDHRILCLGLCLEERFSVNIIKEGLKDLGLPVGSWLTCFKEAIYQGRALDEDFPISWKEKGKAPVERTMVLGDLFQKIARITPGQKIVYITDVVASPENCRKIIALAKGAVLLYIEGAFLHKEADMARKKYHLTARQAGELAAKAGVKYFRLFHFSPRHKDRAHELEREAKKAYDRVSGACSK